MKVLILGGKGMAGHVITAYFQQNPQYKVFYTSRDPEDKDSIYLDITIPTKLEEIIESLKPDIIVNCIGILNDHASNNPKLAFQVNSLLPHELVKLTERNNGKLIHISTDCVFSGTKGNYTEVDIPDGTSFYAQSKQLGEIISDKHLTIRTSIIGPELKEDGIGLFQWFMKQKDQIIGYEKVLWNGVTTLELAKAIEALIENNVTGLYHLGSENKVSKYNLLKLIKRTFNKIDVEILPDSHIVLDRTIKNTRNDFYYHIPPYEHMLKELKSWMEK
ncbi:dTDP-4-dehydrorhamnose reductase family protein [Peribacillus frigoritolerans]|uniref:dTDP-4-dehydrorhamnose reductase family protein n=1 Tax=Peribacillus TaxID=2675229 RepID=UPI000FD876FA|nr:SDR family oxidoreductase [Peribacillus frigoritolerans]AZV59563.1 SDR family NAD(P)-dependent oxidoreductase [Peribacillus frigoritolerans]MCY9140158.1 SDR family oxidoreductase [Peribacillus frigoritolerans]MDM5306692.1 SDR family oxidoreductase [Peribacillus frigoritolerans]MED4692199.1 SDR family oxidoreductase [Peribacillus frigoritolerans]